MPGNTTNAQSKLTYLTIADFTPGIQNQAYTTTSVFPQALSINNPITPSVQGVSATVNSYGCTGLPNGGLLLGPTVFSVQTNVFTWAVATPTSAVVSGITAGAGVSFNDWFVVVNSEQSSAYRTSVYDIKNGSAPFSEDYGETDTHVPPSLGVARASFPFITTLMSSGTPGGYLIVNSVSSEICWWFQQTSHGDLQGGAAKLGYPVPANGRVWWIGSSEGGNGGVVSVTGTPIYNAINYTDPSLPGATNLTLGTQATLIDYDDPSGFGAWGTITSGETMLIKNSPFGGGVLITGDIFSPNVIRAPAVMGTNGMQGQACLSPLGLVYRSYANGVWVWNGGSQATKLSAQLSDSVWPENNSDLSWAVAPASPFPSNDNIIAYNFFNVQFINNFLLFDGGFYYDIQTNSWGRFPPYADSNNPDHQFYPCFYAQNVNSASQFSAVYISPVSATLGEGQITNYAMDVTADNYTFTPPSGYYGSFWQSNPIQVASGNNVEIQRIEVVVQGVGELTIVAVDASTGEEATFTASVNSVSAIGFKTYKRIRMDCKFETDVIQISVGWTNAHSVGNLTPIIDSIRIGYLDRFPVKQAD